LFGRLQTATRFLAISSSLSLPTLAKIWTTKLVTSLSWWSWLWCQRRCGVFFSRRSGFFREYVKGLPYFYRRRKISTRQLQLVANNKCSTDSIPRLYEDNPHRQHNYSTKKLP
jgi:hypothetical protein